MKRDDVIDSVRQAVPECLAAGAVDLATGMLLAVRADAGRSGDDIDLLAASADDFLGGPRLAQLARAFSDGGATVRSGQSSAARVSASRQGPLPLPLTAAGASGRTVPSRTAEMSRAVARPGASTPPMRVRIADFATKRL